MPEHLSRNSIRSPEETARLKGLRESYQRDKPSIADLQARGATFASLGEVVLLRRLADDLRRERELQGLTLERLAERLHCETGWLASIESGRVGVLTFGGLCRIAEALGKRIACAHVETAA